MITRGRLFPARFAIDCFRRQSYSQRELVILDDNPHSELPAYLATLGDQRIRHIAIEPGSHTLGSLRNLARREAHGELIAQWDDDDLYDVRRLSWQVEALRASGAQACFLERWTLWWPARQRIAVSGCRIWEGSVLARREVVPDYPDLRRGEDSAVTDAIVGAHPVALLDSPDLYCYVIHGGNTFTQRHFVNIYIGGTDFAGRQAYARYLDALASRLPVHDYTKDLTSTLAAATTVELPPEPMPDRLVDPAQPGNGTTPTCETPLVSIIVRSMGRACLGEALGTVAAQSYDRLEVLVVDATGGQHPPLPEPIASDPRFRLIGSGRPLRRATAANFGLEAAGGEYIGFLDDDDLFDTSHVALLMRRIQHADHPDFVYAGIWHVDRFHRLVKRVCRPFNPLLAHTMNLIPAISALFHRRMVDLGCRFDETLEVAEDWDFWMQLVPHAHIAWIDAPTQFYFTEAGTSGASTGLNEDKARVAHYVALVHQRREQVSLALWREYTERVQQLLACFYDGDIQPVRAAARALMRRYPGEPNLEFHVGRTYLAQGHRYSASRLFESGLTYVRNSLDFVLTLAWCWEALASPEDGIACLQEARGELTGAWSTIDAEIHRLAGKIQAPETRSDKIAEPFSRNARCQCGSGRRYKQCCGSANASTHSTPKPLAENSMLRLECDRRLAEGTEQYRQGSLVAARETLRAAEELSPGNGLVQHVLALMAYDLGELDESARCADRARAASPGDPVIVEFHRRVHYRRRRLTEANRLRAVLVESPLLAAPEATLQKLYGARSLLVVGCGGDYPLGPADFAGWQGQLRYLSADSEPLSATDASSWCHSGAAMVIDGVPRTLIPLLDGPLPPWVLVRVTRDDPAILGEIATAVGGPISLVYTDDTTARRIGLPGIVLRPAFEDTPRNVTQPSAPGAFTVGLRGSCEVDGLHPSDSTLIRRMLAEHIGVRVHGGTPLLRHFSRSSLPRELDLMSFDAAVEPFHESVDCMLLRRAPLAEPGPALGFIAEGLRAGCALICGRDVPGAELIVDGRNGFLVNSDDERVIFERIVMLRDDPAMAASIRQMAVATFEANWPSGVAGPWSREQAGTAR